MFDVITIGSAVRDVFARTKDIKAIKDKKFAVGEAACFSLGSKLNLDEVNFSVGGGAINTAVTFANQGYKVAAIAQVGDDPEGQHIRDKSDSYGIHCDFLSQDKNHFTSFSFILSLPDGSRTVFRYKGASWYLKEENIPWMDLRAQWLYVNHMAGESHDVLPRLLKEAKDRGMQIAWNPGSTQLEKKNELQQLMSYADLFIVNQEEASKIVGIPYQKKKQIFKRLDELVHGRVIMTEGSKGVEVSDGKTLWSAGVLPLDKSEIVDRTGAGDAFGSGFVAALMRKPTNIEYAIQFASANATGVLTEWGAAHGLLKKGDSANKYGILEIKETRL
ncbi:MAG: carbohydrate kinase family protein [Candidatus Wildermuthbacteria bacterium]|nr:carbohydrate kinase family protein [Candidatus Wildermuthbacteria bacterium]